MATEKAKTRFLDRNAEILRSLAKNALYDVLRYGTRTVRENILQEPNKEGELVIIEKKITTTTGGAPQWAIERVLGRPTEELEAVKKLIESEWFDKSAAIEIPSCLEKFNTDVRDILKRNSL